MNLEKWIEDSQSVIDQVRALAEVPAQPGFRPMSLYLENLRTREEMEAARSRGWEHGAAVFTGYSDEPAWLGRWLNALGELDMSGRVSMTYECFDGFGLTTYGERIADILSMSDLDGVELENSSDVYIRRVNALLVKGVQNIFQYQRVYSDDLPNLSKLWYSMYSQASEVGHVGSIKAWRMDPFNAAPMRSWGAWKPVRTTDNRPNNTDRTGHVWIECMGDPVGEVVKEADSQFGVIMDGGRWKRQHEDRYAIPPGRGHFDYYLQTCHRMNINQVTFYSARHQSWGDRRIWDANPKLWDDLIESVNAYMSGPYGIPDTWSDEYKNTNPYVTTIKLKEG